VADNSGILAYAFQCRKDEDPPPMLYLHLLLVSEMTYTVSSGTLNSSIPYHSLVAYSLSLDTVTVRVIRVLEYTFH